MEKNRNPDDRGVALVLHRFVALDPQYRLRLANSKPAKWRRGIAALNRTIVRLANGEDVSPKTRRLLVKALSSGQVELIPGRPSKGRTRNPGRDDRIIRFVQAKINKSPGKRGARAAAYRAAEKKFGRTAKCIEQIARHAAAIRKSNPD